MSTTRPRPSKTRENLAVEGSAGYVAIERVEGSLRGRKGSFILMHQGAMQRTPAST